MRRALRGWGWLAPAMVILLLVAGWPVGRAVYQSLYSGTLTDPDAREFVGSSQIANVLSSSEWWLAVAVSLTLVIIVVLIQVGLGFAFAAALSRLTAAIPVTRVVVLLPFAVLSIVTAFAWRDAVATGFVAEWFRLGELSPTGELAAWAAGEVWRGTAIVTVIVWVGLDRVSRPLLEAARADGATSRQRLVRVVLPAVGPFVAAATAYRVLDTFRSIDGALLGTTSSSTLRPATLLVWDASFSSYELGLAATTSLVLLVVAGFLGLLLVPLLRVRRAL